MRIVNVWGTYIDLDRILAIEEEPEVLLYYNHAVRLTLHLAFRNDPFLIIRGFLEDERQTIRHVGSSTVYKVIVPEEPVTSESSEPDTFRWILERDITPEMRPRTLAYLRAKQALDLLRELWGGRGKIDIPTIPRDSIPDLTERT